MSNSHFSFKQFTIHQDKCAMKICTDSCLFGAIISSTITHKKNALDIGSGTGLLSLMYAQKNVATIIHAVEIDENAYNQSLQNINASPFANAITVSHSSIFNLNPNIKYQFIFSNPPFFKHSLKSIDKQRNIAMHNDELSYELLIKSVVQLLEIEGQFAVLLSFSAQKEFIAIANSNNLFATKIINVKQTISHAYFRTILFFAFAKTEIMETEISIKDNENQYTKEFVDLLKDYYLIF